jgi:hypothetical protein
MGYVRLMGAAKNDTGQLVFSSEFEMELTTHVHHPPDYPGSAACRRITHLALQHRLGILPERWLGASFDHRAGFGLDGTRLTRTRIINT